MAQNSFQLAGAFGYLSYGEVIGLKAIAASLPDGAICVNLGAGSGTSALAILEDRRDLITSFTTVDISQVGPLGGLDNERMAFEANEMTVFPNQILGDTLQVVKGWNAPIDYLFIDDDHSETHLRDEIAAWLPKLAENAIVAFHDYGSPMWGGVKTVIDDTILKDPQFTPLFLWRTLIAFRKGTRIGKEPYAPRF